MAFISCKNTFFYLAIHTFSLFLPSDLASRFHSLEASCFFASCKYELFTDLRMWHAVLRLSVDQLGNKGFSCAFGTESQRDEMKETNAKRIIETFMLVCLCFVSTCLFAQESLQKESDGFTWTKICQDGKVGAKDAYGATIIPLSRGYTGVVYHSGEDGYFSVWFDTNSGKQGACDKSGKEIVAPGKYDNVYYQNKDGFEFYSVKLNEKEGICDNTGKEIVSPKYDYVSLLDSDGVYYYRTELWGKKGVCDLSGKEVLTPIFDDVFMRSSDEYHYFDVKRKWKHGVYDLSGREVIAPKYNNIYLYSSGECPYFKVKRIGLEGICDLSGKELVAPKYKTLIYSSNTFKYQKLFLFGEWVSTGITLPANKNVDFNYTSFNPKDDLSKQIVKRIPHTEEDGFVWNATVAKDKKVGAEDAKGRRIIAPTKYDNISYNNGYFIVKQKKKTGICNKKGKEIITPNYDNVYYSDHNSFWIKKNGKYGVCNMYGNEIIMPKYDDIAYHDEDKYNEYYGIKLGKKHGVCDLKGDVVIEPIYDAVTFTDYKFFWVKKGSKYGAYDKLGREIAEPNYDNLTYYTDGFKYTDKDGQLVNLDVTVDNNGFVQQVTYNNSYEVANTESSVESTLDKIVTVLEAVSAFLGTVSDAMEVYAIATGMEPVSNLSYNDYSYDFGNFSTSYDNTDLKKQNAEKKKREEEDRQRREQSKLEKKQRDYEGRFFLDYMHNYEGWYKLILNVKTKTSVSSMSPRERKDQLEEAQRRCKQLLKDYKEKTGGHELPVDKSLLNWRPDPEDLVGD